MLHSEELCLAVEISTFCEVLLMAVLPALETQGRGRQARVLVRGKAMPPGAFLFCRSINTTHKEPLSYGREGETLSQNFIKRF